MDVIFYDNFTKRQNSTKQPGGGEASHTVSGTIKEGCSILSPSISFSFGRDNVPGWGFAYIPAFSRYYHVTNWTYQGGLWTCDMAVDVLASFKTNILNDYAYVIFSTSDFNDKIRDSRLSCLNAPSSHVQVSSPAFSVSNEGCVVLQVISSTGGNGTTAYALTAAQVGELIQKLSTEDIAELGEEVTRLFGGGSMNAICSATWMPFNWASGGLGPGTFDVVIGNYNTGIKGNLHNYVSTSTTSISIPWQYSDFRKTMCTIQLFLPFLGTVSISPDEFCDSSSIGVTYSFDPISGGFTCILQGNVNGSAVYSGSCGCSIPLASLSVSAMGATLSAGSALGSLATGNVTGVLGDIFSTVEKAMVPTTQTVGGYTGQSGPTAFINAQTEIVLTLNQIELSMSPDGAAGAIGRPLYAPRLLSTLSGFCQCAGMSSSAGGLEEETSQINDYLNGGFYIE